MSKKYVECLFLLGFLEVENDSELVSPSFTQPKSKSNQVHFLSDFRNINKQSNQKPYPMPKVNEMVLKPEVFQCAASLGLNMGYYHIQLSKKVSNLCTIILPLGKKLEKVYQWGLQTDQTFSNGK